MIFICNSANHVTPFFWGSLRQGEINANEILFLAPYPLKGTTVSLRVTLPNGIVLPADPSKAFVFAEIDDPNMPPLNLGDVALNAWRLRVDAAITEFSGNVTFQFAIARVGGEGIPPALITTDTVVENIPRGVPALIPSNADYDPSLIDLYNTAVAALANAQNSIDEAYRAANSAETSWIYAETAANRSEEAAAQAVGIKDQIVEIVGDLQSAFDELHTYAQNIINGGEEQ